MQDFGGVVERVNESVEDLERLIHDNDHDFTIDNLILRDRMDDIRKSRAAYEETARQIKLTKQKMATLEKNIKRLEADRKTAIRNNEDVAPLDNRIEELRKNMKPKIKFLRKSLGPRSPQNLGKLEKPPTTYFTLIKLYLKK